MCVLCQMGYSREHSTPTVQASAGSLTISPEDLQNWQNIDQTPDNPFNKDTNYETFLTYLGALNRPLTPAMAQSPIVVNLSELSDHPAYLEAATGALQMWSAVTPLQFTIVTDRPFNAATDYLEVVSPEVGEQDDGSAYSAGRYVSVGQRFHDTEPDATSPGGYIFNTFIHEFGHEWGLNHPGFYNYGGPGGPQITYYNDAKWVYDNQQYSVMSYFDNIDIGGSTAWTNTTPGIADIEAVIRHYFSTVTNGVRSYQDIQLNTGDDVYGFGSTRLGYTLTADGSTHDIGFVIHDTGGHDTVDFSGSTDSTILDLREGRFSSVNGHTNNVAIFDGHNADATEYYIEKGVGSAYLDIIIGNDGDNELLGGGGDDRIDGGNGADEIHGGSGDDIIVGGADTNDSRDRNNTLPIITGPDSKDGDDLLYGEDGNDTINAGKGDDVLDGGAGDDIMRGMAGVDVFIGGAGNDTVDFSLESPFQLLVNLVTNVAAGGTASGDTFFSVENLIGSDDRIDRFVGNDSNNYFLGLGGGDVLNGGNGDDKLEGARDGDVLSGDAGNDLLIGGAGADFLDGGAGIDTADYTLDERQPMFGPPRTPATEGVTVNLATGTASGGDGEGDTTTTHQFDKLTNIENVIGSKFADTLIGNAGVNVLSGAAGDDVLAGGGGLDTLNGGAGLDMAAYYGSATGVNVSLLVPGSHPETYISIEGLAGSAHKDQLTGDALANKLVGQGGDDVLKGNAGNDTIDGDFTPFPVTGVGMGTGYTTLAPSATNNSVATAHAITNNFSLAADADIGNATTLAHSTVNATGNGQGGYYKLTVNAGTVITADIDHTSDGLSDSFLWLERADGTVVAFNDDGGNDPGSARRTDSLFSFKVTETGDYYIVVGQYNNDTGDTEKIVPSGATYELNVSVTPPPPTSPNIGLAGHDNLDGGDGDDTLYGRGGADFLRGGAGADHLDGGAGADTVSYYGSTDAVTVNLATGIGSGGEAQGDTLVGIEAVNGGKGGDTLTGNVANNVLNGYEGNDVINGGAGRDTLSGGTGADRFVFSAAGDSGLGANADVGTDFSRAQGDKIDLSGIDANTGAAGNQAFTYIGSGLFTHHAGELRAANTSSGVITIAGDLNGDGVSDFHIVLKGLNGVLVASDFVL
ncbi:M10 family metallopeptidase C-terminal domain-containing protein [Mycobacterium sp. KBS0706]|uniref:M10 family metallopeptidase C-terminal domain-containing protein n=1 Tax=Mycobacterium sp. KBS0706 TaxID=2578109 RepID=UPI00163D3DD9|nr:M10 family metallopeptidase C-terminal domain-containing protein [Mycobacterium sp. KBS0706]